jgi:hypothetical protein
MDLIALARELVEGGTGPRELCKEDSNDSNRILEMSQGIRSSNWIYLSPGPGPTFESSNYVIPICSLAISSSYQPGLAGTGASILSMLLLARHPFRFSGLLE